MKANSSEITDSRWLKTPVANLVRHVQSGNYYARIRVRGKLIWKSLRTDRISVAKLRLGDFHKEERKRAATGNAVARGKMTFGDAVTAYLQQRKNDPNIKHGTVEYDDYRIKALLESWPELRSKDVSKITGSNCKLWSELNAKKVSSSSHNHTVGILRRIFKIAIEAGARYDNPASAAIWIKEHTKKQIKLPESGQLEKLVEEIRNSGSGFAKPSAELVQFLAFGGFRKSEAKYVTWADCDFERGKIIVRGSPETGLKARRVGESRIVPMIPEMRLLLEKIKGGKETPSGNSVMRVFECKKSIATACKKLGIPRFTHHDLRHLFATRCIESGVDIPTISRWLGHKDGGALAMKTYGHLRDQHSTNMAQKVVFSETASTSVPLRLYGDIQFNGEAAANGNKTAIPEAKSKYGYPWWASKNPLEVFWGQLNEQVQIVSFEKFHECAKQAMKREVFAAELVEERDALREEFVARIPKATHLELDGKIYQNESDSKLKAG